MALQPRNTKIMRREGPWGRAGWFRSRYLTLTDATAGRLERSRRHSAACRTASPTRHLPQAGPTEVQAGPSHRQPPHQVGAGRPQGATQSGRGVGWGYGVKRVGAGPLQGTGGGNWGLLGAPWPSGAAMCVRDTQSTLLCLYSYEAEGVCAREAKCECGCDGDEARTWVHVFLGTLITPLCPSRATAVLVGASHAGARGGRV